MKHTLPTSSFRQELEALKQLNGWLQRLITNCTASGFPAQGRQPITPHRLSPDILKENTAHAEDLYHAICNSYNCECPSPHEANLGLRQMSPKPLNAGEPFELIFPIDEEKEDMKERDLKSPLSLTYCSITSTEMASTTDESYDSFGIEYDTLPADEHSILIEYTGSLTGAGHQGIALEVYQHHPPEIRKAASHPHGIEEGAQFLLAGAIMAQKMLNASMTSVYSSKNWMTLHLSSPRLLVWVS